MSRKLLPPPVYPHRVAVQAASSRAKGDRIARLLLRREGYRAGGIPLRRDPPHMGWQTHVISMAVARGSSWALGAPERSSTAGSYPVFRVCSHA